MLHTVLLNTNKFNRFTDGTQTSSIILGQGGPGSNGNEGVLFRAP